MAFTFSSYRQNFNSICGINKNLFPKASTNRTDTALLLSETYKNPQNVIILTFLKPIVNKLILTCIFKNKISITTKLSMKPALINHLNNFSDLQNYAT
jgi:hypothetical protein